MKKKMNILYLHIVFAFIIGYVASISSYATTKPPQTKITVLCPYNWYANEEDSYNDYDYTPEYEYYDNGKYNDASGYYVKKIDLSCKKVKGNVNYEFAIRIKGDKLWRPEGRQ